jgi:hypothetical protein
MAPNLEHVKRASYSSEEHRTGSVTSFNVIPPKQHLQYGAMTVAAGILIAQLHSQSKLTSA